VVQDTSRVSREIGNRKRLLVTRSHARVDRQSTLKTILGHAALKIRFPPTSSWKQNNTSSFVCPFSFSFSFFFQVPMAPSGTILYGQSRPITRNLNIRPASCNVKSAIQGLATNRGLENSTKRVASCRC